MSTNFNHLELAFKANGVRRRKQREIEQLNEQIDLMKQDNKVYITEENKNRLGAHENNFERTMRFTRTDKDSLEQLVNAFKLMKPFEGPKF